jgi:hypothetical protein
LSIKSDSRLQEPLKTYLATDDEVEEEGVLTDEVWAQSAATYQGLKPFGETTMRLEGHGLQASYGVV